VTDLILIAPPAYRVLTLAEVKAHLRIDGDQDDAVLYALIDAATGHLDGGDGILGRALIEQTWEQRLDRFPCRRGGSWDADFDDVPAEIVLRLLPVIAIVSIAYVNDAGATVTMSGADYQLIQGGVAKPARIAPAFGKTWPFTGAARPAVTVRFRAGYEAADGSPVDPAGNVPMAIKQALLLLIGHWYENREAAQKDKLEALPFAVQALVDQYRVGWMP